MFDGAEYPISALIDTGAEINLLRQGLLPPHYFSLSPNPRRFVTAGQAQMAGGKLEVSCGVILQGTNIVTQKVQKIVCPALF